MGRWLAALALLVALAAPAIAQTPTGGASIALIPFTAEKRLKLYGTPVAAEITRALREAGLDVVLVSEGEAVPPRARLVVDGRLVRKGAGVVIEARIRDPERGVDVARPSGTAPALGDIDRAAAAVAGELVTAIRAGLAEQDAAAAKSRAALAPAAGPPVPEPSSGSGAGKPRPVDRRPLAIVVVSARDIADGAGAPVDVTALVAPAAIELGARLGHRVAVEHAPPGGTFQPSAYGSRGASLLVTFELLDFLRGTQAGIPIARARARVTVLDAQGNRVYRRIVRTDTLVGSRGDRVDTLVGFAAAQVSDVVSPRIRERLGASGAP
jgi:hypothetical protein